MAEKAYSQFCNKIKITARYVELAFTFDVDTPAVAQDLITSWRINPRRKLLFFFFLSQIRSLFRKLVDYPLFADIVLKNAVPLRTIRAYDSGFPSTLRINTILDTVWQKFLDVHFASRNWKKQNKSSLLNKWVLPRSVPVFCIGARIVMNKHNLNTLAG